MKAILEFNLPEDQDDYELANNARNMLYVLSELKDHLRSTIKHGEMTDDKYDAYDEVWSKLFELMSEYSVRI